MSDPTGRSRADTPLPDVVIRSIRPSDAPGLRAFHARLSDTTIRNRFFGSHPVLQDAEVLRFTGVVAGTVALVVTVAEQIVAVGRYIRLGADDAAEVAFVVEDRYQGHGLGTALLTRLARIASDDGIHRFVADTFATNSPMIDVFLHTPQAVAVTETRRDGSVVHVVMAVHPPENLLSTVSEDRSDDRPPLPG